MMEMIQQKIDGQEISVPQEAQAETKIVDLMAALKASVDGKSKRKKAAGGAPRKSAARAARKPAATKAKSSTRRKAR
jgi:non-homologous end joining protein Ku